MITSLKEIVLKANNMKKKIAVASAEDKELLVSLAEAERHGMVSSLLLFGNAIKIKEIIEKNNLNLKKIEIINAVSSEEAAYLAAKAVSDQEADILMKGMVDTRILLKALLKKELALREYDLISHVMIYEMKSYHKLILLTDAGMVLNPSLKDKENIIHNAKVLADVLDIHPMKVAVLSAVEKLNPDIQSSVDAYELKRIFETCGYKDIIVEGPLSFDLAVSKESAMHKGVKGEVPGDADVFLVPNVEAGNLLGKSFTYMADAESAGIILGAKCPVILTSRSDSSETKLNSIALAIFMTIQKGEE